MFDLKSCPHLDSIQLVNILSNNNLPIMLFIGVDVFCSILLKVLVHIVDELTGNTIIFLVGLIWKDSSPTSTPTSTLW